MLRFKFSLEEKLNSEFKKINKNFEDELRVMSIHQDFLNKFYGLADGIYRKTSKVEINEIKQNQINENAKTIFLTSIEEDSSQKFKVNFYLEEINIKLIKVKYCRYYMKYASL